MATWPKDIPRFLFLIAFLHISPWSPVIQKVHNRTPAIYYVYQ
jgi:hypothetical protein